MKYSVGDKVVVKKDLNMRDYYSMEIGSGVDSAVSEMLELRGKTVTIKRIASSGKYIIEEDTRWTWTDEMFKSTYPKILITTDGTTTLARLYDGKKVVKSAEAKCAPGDTFDFAVGARLAFDRLMGVEQGPKIKWSEPESKQDKHVFKVGDKARVKANTCFHHAEVGDVVTLEDRYTFISDCSDPGWCAEGVNGFILERDLEPYAEPIPAPEPIKLYCVNDCFCGCVKQGKIYEVDADGKIQNEHGKSCDAELRINGGWLFPLVHRPAKVGEWVIPDGECQPIKIYRECTSEKGCLVFSDDRHTRITKIKYLVLDGYSGTAGREKE